MGKESRIHTKWLVFFLVVGLAVAGQSALGQSSADLDTNGFVDAADLLLLQQQWHTGGAYDPSIPPQAQIASTIVAATIPADNRPEVEFTLQDGNGNPVNPEDLRTFRFTICKIVENVVSGKPEYTQYKNYITTTVMNEVGDATPGTVTGVQPTYDSGRDDVSNITQLPNGNLLYKFEQAIDFQTSDMGLTHTVGAQIEYEVDGVRTVANPLFNFVPNGSPVTTVRELSDTKTCNSCHDKLAIHGGGRQEFGLCILCHTPQQDNIDPDSGNLLDMASMIHKIHRGADLPLAATSPFIIYGFRNSEHNYSHVEFPQDIRNCDVCHTGSVEKGTPGAQADLYLSTPSRRACGACHEDVDFETGVGHGPGIPQTDDTSCTICHPNTMTSEFDMSVPGAHTVPIKSTQLAGLNAEILEVQNAVPGSAPTIRFRLFDNENDPIDIQTLDLVQATYAGPTTDYATHTNERVFGFGSNNAVTEVTGTYSYTFNTTIDASAEGTYAFGIEARGQQFELSPGKEHSAVRESVFNPVVYVALDGSAPVPRREPIDFDKCNKCHDQLTLHGTLRKNYEYCVMCHRPGQTDNPFRADAVAADPTIKATPESVNFKNLIHMIHTGSELDQVAQGDPYIIIGFNAGVHDYSHVEFPGRRENCEMCHVPDGQALPTPEGALATVIESASPYMPIGSVPPMTAACTSCHDSDAAKAHADAFVALTGQENCAECHGKAHEWGYDIVHFAD